MRNILPTADAMSHGTVAIFGHLTPRHSLGPHDVAHGSHPKSHAVATVIVAVP